MSAGKPSQRLSAQSHAEEIRETASRLASAQVAVYPVDARGLSISSDIDAQETMREMARETGGRAYVNQNEIKVGVERAFDDESAAYTLGYYPENKKYDGKYRSIKVKVKRDGIEIHNRRGYYAIDPTQVKGYKPQQEVASALGDIVPSTMVAFTAQVKPPAVNSVPGKIGVTYLVDASTLSAEDASGGKHLERRLLCHHLFARGKDGCQQQPEGRPDLRREYLSADCAEGAHVAPGRRSPAWPVAPRGARRSHRIGGNHQGRFPIDIDEDSGCREHAEPVRESPSSAVSCFSFFSPCDELARSRAASELRPRCS